MPLEAEELQISSFAWLLRSGGFPFLAFGMLLAIAGIVLILIRPSRNLVVVYAIVSLIPGIMAMLAIYGACTEFTEMGTSHAVPKPADIAAVVGRGMSCGFFGLLSTLVTALLTTLAFLRSPRPNETHAG